MTHDDIPSHAGKSQLITYASTSAKETGVLCFPVEWDGWKFHLNKTRTETLTARYLLCKESRYIRKQEVCFVR